MLNEVYGTQINSDVVLPLELPTDTAGYEREMT